MGRLFSRFCKIGGGRGYPIFRLRNSGPGTDIVSRYALRMAEVPISAAITIHPAASADANGITSIYLESADYHAQLDPERYWIPSAEAISARYREGRQHPPEAEGNAITLVAKLAGEIVGFVDARLTQSADPMHREMTYCYIVEIAVSSGHQSRGIGAQLVHAVEDWGRKQGAEFASLEYLAANPRAGAFYQRQGYRAGTIVAIKRL